MEFHVSKEHTRDGIGLNIVKYVIAGATLDKKTNIAAWLWPMWYIILYLQSNLSQRIYGKYFCSRLK